MVTDQRTKSGFLPSASIAVSAELTHDGSGGETEENDKDDERRESVTRGDDGWDGGDDQEEVGNDTDGSPDAQHLESTVPGIGEDTTKDGDEVRQELEHVVDG